MSKYPEGHMTVIVSGEIARGSARSETPHMHGNALHGNRESLGSPARLEGRAGRSGKSKDTRH